MTTAIGTLTISEAQQELTAIEDRQTDRDDQLQAIAFHEMRLTLMRAALDTAIKRFYHFRCHPQQHVYVYAADKQQASARLRERMSRSYGNEGEGWKITSQVVKVYDDPIEACNAAPDNLLRCLSESEAREFIADYDADKKGRAEPPRPKDVPMPQLERDIENYRIRLRMKDA